MVKANVRKFVLGKETPTDKHSHQFYNRVLSFLYVEGNVPAILSMWAIQTVVKVIWKHTVAHRLSLRRRPGIILSFVLDG